MASADEPIDAATVFLCVCTVVVLLMTMPGLALFYGSLVSRKNLLETMLQSVVLTATISLLWWLLGYSLCFSAAPHEGLNLFLGGFDRILLQFDTESKRSNIPESAWCVFQLTFGIITPNILTGSVVERSLLWPLMLFANIWFMVVYCPLCHMVWGGGLLAQWGVLDLAGGLVVETSSGVGAFVLCYIVGPRSLAPEVADAARAMLHIIGAALLWVGWLSFNAGSAFSNGFQASTTVLSTILSGASGSLAWLLTVKLCKFGAGIESSAAAFNLMGGAIAGLCAATPSAGFVPPWAAVTIGVGAGCLCRLAEAFLMDRFLKKYGFDDTVAVFAVHGVAGIWGTLMTGVFASHRIGGARGAIEGNWGQVRIQALSILVVLGWSALGTAISALVVHRCCGLRATLAEEEQGMDSIRHGDSANRIHRQGFIGRRFSAQAVCC